MSIDARVESAAVAQILLVAVAGFLVHALHRGTLGEIEVSGLLIGTAGGLLAYALWCAAHVVTRLVKVLHALVLVTGPLGSLWIMFISPGFARGYVVGAAIAYLCCTAGKDLADWMHDRQARARDTSRD